MRASVSSKFLDFTKPLEGYVEYMYADIKGLVTVGIGNLIDPVNTATSLPFVDKKTGRRATKQEIVAEWNLIKDPRGTRGLARKGHRACAPLTKLRLTEAAIHDLCERKLNSNEANLKKVTEFQAFDSWPADAQLALLSMAWAMGPGFASAGKWPKFRKACGAMDFDAAAANCQMSTTGNPGLIKRNTENQTLLRNAAAVLAGEADGFYNRETLYWPQINAKPVAM
ncbi:hypothetical protein Mal15_67380 [Stieleria maiorica]|uniref:Lysozyme n=1 Tax=Stieleria maiorica TaxID=2795974 RepID=A0A5B9MRD1_9BACT|nr:hypothetical protein [Stieleria maiorica]QEG02617.1 hypothetical protein Mal15_67380 [Stieleria maiorica]